MKQTVVKAKMVNSSKKLSHKKLSTRIYQSRQLYILLALPLIWLITFKYIPMVGAQIAFRDYSPRGGIFNSDWVGLENFIRFFKSPRFFTIIRNTITISLYQIVAGFPVPIILALAINSTSSKKFAKIVQTTTYLPHFISTVVMIGILMQILNPITGLTGSIAQLLGVEAVDLMAKPSMFKSLYVWSGVWQNAGWGTIIYLATLTGVDPSLHEAAVVDGANRFKRVIHVDIPAILPTAITLLIMNTGKVMSVGFEKAYLMQNTLNIQSSEIIATFVYKTGLAAGGDFSYSTAIGLFNSIVNLIFIISVNKLAKKFSETSLW